MGEGGVMHAIATFCIRAMVLLYRATLRPFIGGHCRFHPTCSQYMLDAVAKYGPWKGFAKGLWRVCRCNPLGGCGCDEA